TTTFTDSKTQTVFHRDWVNQGNNHFDVVAWHYHFYAFWQFNSTSYVSSTEVELWTVAFEEWSVTTTFFFRQYVHFRFELGVRSYRVWLTQNLATLNFVTLGTAQQNTYVLTRTTFVEQLAEHFNTGTGGFDGVFQTNDLNFLTHLDDTALNTTGYHSTATRN